MRSAIQPIVVIFFILSLILMQMAKIDSDATATRYLELLKERGELMERIAKQRDEAIELAERCEGIKPPTR